MVSAVLLLGLFLVSSAGLVVDERTLLGESVWVKPLKFGFAFSLYTATLAWLLTKLTKGRRLAWWLGTVFAVISLAEIAAITVQAARGTFSHFNADQADPVTLAMVPVLTYGVLIIVLTQLVIAVIVLIQQNGGPALNTAIRAGVGLATFGMLVPIYWMVTEIHPRTVTDANGAEVQMYQGHGIGDPDGHGMPLTNWSTTGGDFRVPHFFALHGIQALLLVTLALAALAARHAWLRDERVRARLVGAASLGYTGLVAIVTWQAGRGQSLIHPDAQTLVAAAAVALITAAVAVLTIVKALKGTDMTSSSAPDRSRVRSALENAVTKGGAPGMVAEIRDSHGRWFGSAGVSDTRTGRERHAREGFRIGSATKAFTAAVVLQLVAEGKLGLDDTVERWLPGLVTGNGYDGDKITIRQLLNHTSGIFNYGNDAETAAKGMGAAWFEHRYDKHSPEELVSVGLRNPPYFAPGQGFGYSNTNYFLAAMIVERATGSTYDQELTSRIIGPLELTGTYLPGDDARIRGPHPTHYSTLFSQDPVPEIHDATDMNQSFAWAAGGVVSTTGDLQRFFNALLGGRLLPEAQQRQLFTTVETKGGPPWIPSTRYGLGVFSQTLPCGVEVWGNGGATYGSWVYAMGSRDGGHLLTSQVNGDWSGLGVFDDVLDAEFRPAGSP